MATDYTTITEVPGGRATTEQLSMLYTRYHTAATLSEGKDVLEVACGCGQGLGYLAKQANCVVGGDYTESLLHGAQQCYRGRVPLVCLDAHILPFQNASFDVLVLFEAIYYLARLEEFLDESLRVLRPGGKLLICSTNKECSGFNPSRFSTNYLSAGELRQILTAKGFDVEVFGAFPVSAPTFGRKASALIRNLAVQLNLIPKTMKGKELLKRIFYGPLTRIEDEVKENMAELAPLHPISETELKPQYRVLYTLGRTRAGVPALVASSNNISKRRPVCSSGCLT